VKHAVNRGVGGSAGMQPIGIHSTVSRNNRACGVNLLTAPVRHRQHMHPARATLQRKRAGLGRDPQRNLAPLLTERIKETKAIFAAIALLNVSLTTGAFALSANAYTQVFPSNETSG
jgi:hypothetical protein